MTFDAITADAPHDADFPADMLGLVLSSAGASLNGVMYRPAGEGPHPLAVLLHGFPGYERNFDLAQILRRAGWITVIFHYRGAWGSGGNYRFQHVLEDVQQVLAYFRTDEAAAHYRIDRNRILTIGHSVGGWAALMAAAHGWVDQSVSIAGVHMGHWTGLLQSGDSLVESMLTESLTRELAPLAGVGAADLITELQTQADAFNPLRYLPQLAQRRLLLIAGKQDMQISPFDHHMPLLDALKTAGAQAVTGKLLKADHDFGNARIALAQTILEWLGTV